MRQVTLTVLAIFVLALDTPVNAQSLDDGVRAYSAGDYETAFKIFLTAAKQGNASMQGAVGKMYREGLGVEQNYAKALHWSKMSAEQGNVSSQYDVGWMYFHGVGIPQNSTNAWHWFKLAAKQGHATAQFGLSLLYSQDRGVPLDVVTAHMWANISKANKEHTDNTELLEALNKYMTPAQISEAQARAEKCFNSNYEDCD